MAEARANNEARTEQESRLREAEEREAMLVQALEDLRQTLTRKEQQVFYFFICALVLLSIALLVQRFLVSI